jgi:WhiB family transcriptional regulator, redox-sensing transcriptional regulator
MQRHQDRQEPAQEETVTNGISSDPTSHGGISDLVPAAGYDRSSWRESAACRQGADPELFFPIGSAGIAITEIQRAKAICDSCPVRQSCLTFALTTHQEFGIWGGYDETERRLLHRQRRTRARQPSTGWSTPGGPSRSGPGS